MTTSALPLVSRHTCLRPPTLAFLDHLFQRASVGDIPWLWPVDEARPGEFARSLGRHSFVQLAIVDRRTDEPAGLISAYDVDLLDGIAYVSLALLPECQMRMWPLEGAILFANYMFTRFSLRKLCGRSVDASFAHLRSGQGAFFEVEGVLKGHRLVDGEPQDMHLAAVTLDRWREIGIPLLERITSAR